MYNPKTCLAIICELHELVDVTSEKLNQAKLDINHLLDKNQESEATIRGLISENGHLQTEINRLVQKYETQRQ